MTAVKERPIIFSADSVRAILAGRKTQTRRLVKPQPVDRDTIIRTPHGFEVGRLRDSENAWRDIACQFGRPGDRLWVRETWAYASELVSGYQVPDGPYYEADGIPIIAVGRWRSPIFMPRWASRLTLEITDVRVQRLQEISEQDAIAEGVDAVRLTIPADTSDVTSRVLFADLWNQINGKRAPWESNPWVWAISFRLAPA